MVRDVLTGGASEEVSAESPAAASAEMKSS